MYEISGIYYDKWSYSFDLDGKFKFNTIAENNPNWDWEVDIDSIVEGEYEEVKELDAHKSVGDKGNI